ncbi:hypothetical protein BJ508DRAFT_59285 [Ascobolus immersus RN42]|uniref:F-box domain-containing protein n=1 Tax=Ascobolus immersus RN42 TaxID=1160509 RepID=A0A3N4IMP2_ASCIM|nr:hypothetical protein BJ508DRAFT_59285 [Ascobolus immersus RN42]
MAQAAIAHDALLPSQGLLRSLLDLPLELRLEIYSFCPAFTLLQLSHSISFFYYEINQYPAILRLSGFKARSCTPTSKSRLCMPMITRITDWYERRLFDQLHQPNSGLGYGPQWDDNEKESSKGTVLRRSYARCMHCSKVGRFILYGYGLCKPCYEKSYDFVENLDDSIL